MIILNYTSFLILTIVLIPVVVWFVALMYNTFVISVELKVIVGSVYSCAYSFYNIVQNPYIFNPMKPTVVIAALRNFVGSVTGKTIVEYLRNQPEYQENVTCQ